MFENIENFDNAVEFLVPKALFYKHYSLIISYWKIISNYSLNAFLCKVMVNYASKMIRIRLNSYTIFWKRREFLHGLNNLKNFVTAGTIRRLIFSFFANQNFSRDIKVMLLRKWITLVLQVKFCFMGCLVKANALLSENR